MTLLRLLRSREMLIFSFTLFYTGLHQVMWGGVYTTSIGFTEALGEDRKKIAALSGIMFGAGEVLGGILFGFLGNLTLKRGRDPVILLGFSVSVVSYFLIFLNLPASAPLHPTLDLGYLGQPNSYVAYLTGFLMGFSDACFLTQVKSYLFVSLPLNYVLQVYAILGGAFEDPSSAFAIFKFYQSLASGLGSISRPFNDYY